MAYISLRLGNMGFQGLLAALSRADLQRLYGIGDRAALRLGDQQMYVFRHNHESVNLHAVQLACPFQCLHEEVADKRIAQMGIAVVTGERDEVG